MKLERSKNTKRNIYIGIINKIVTLFFPFMVQTIIIRILGTEYIGLKGLFSSILQVLNLAELGFGSALVFSMYKPIASNDKDTICSLLNLYKKIYRRVGSGIMIVGLALLPFLPHLISGAYPEKVNIYILYVMYLLNTVLSYLMFAYKASLLNAFQRIDIINLIGIISQGFMYILQMVLLIVLKNYYVYMMITILCTIINNLLISWNVDKMFPEYKCYGEVPQYILVGLKKKLVGLMLFKICAATRNTFDCIFISMFLGLTFTGIYNNYYYILNAVIGILSIVSSSMLAGVGNSIALESIEKNYKDMRKLNYLYMLIAGWCSVYMICLYQPFMELWIGRKLMLSFDIVVLFTLYFYILKMGDIRGMYADAAGLWWENRYRTVFEAIVNLILNYFFVNIWGIFGIVLATIISVFIFGFFGASIVLFKYYFRYGFKEFMKEQFLYLFITIVNCIITYSICGLINKNLIIILLGRFVVCSIISPLIFLIFYYKTEIFKDSISWLFQKMNIKFYKLKK